MSNQRLLFPESILAELQKRYNKRHRLWLTDNHDWPMALELGAPTEEEVFRDRELVQKWITSWRSWSGTPSLEWRERRWKQLGTQSIPHKLVFGSAMEVADSIGQGQRWRRAVNRHTLLLDRWPSLCLSLSKHFDMLADYEDIDFQRLERLIEWFTTNQNSNLYPRQIPMSGIDTKWFEKRSSLISELFSIINPGEEIGSDIFIRLGLKRPPDRCRMRILDHLLAESTGGITDLEAPIEELNHLKISPKVIFIIENLQTFLAFGELSNAVAVLGMGYRVTQMCAFPWLQEANCYYWGDIDTHGFAILSQARALLPKISSKLMDEQTLLENKTLWSREEAPTMMELPGLVGPEREIYDGLRNQAWGTNVRLEQERLSWEEAWKVIVSSK